MRVLVTGATGFLGREIVGQLLESEFEVICLSRKNALNGISQKKTDIRFVEADISDGEEIRKIQDSEKLGKIDVFIHCAGLAHQFGKIIVESFQKINVDGTRNIAELANRLGCRRFILISSVAVYDSLSNKANPITEKTECKPKGFYAESKYRGEQVCREICLKNNIPLTILRPSTIIGEGDKGNVLRLIKTIDRGFFARIGRGTNLKSLIYKKDAAAACLEIIRQSRENFEIYNLTAEPVTMNEIVSEISLKLNKKGGHFTVSERIFEPFFKLNEKVLKSEKIKRLEETLVKWQSDEVFSAESIKEKYGFSPLISIKEAIGLEIDWYLKQK